MRSISVKLAQIGVITLATAFMVPVFADEGHRHDSGTLESGGHMMDSSEMSEHMKTVMGVGRINKVMGDKHMMNISHEPIAELNWPKMRMNFKVDPAVDLSQMKPGQEVTFTLEVDQASNYLIKKIDVK